MVNATMHVSLIVLYTCKSVNICSVFKPQKDTLISIKYLKKNVFNKNRPPVTVLLYIKPKDGPPSSYSFYSSISQ